MSSDAKVRIVAFVSSTIAEQYAALSRRFGLSRSELVRMALQRGYRSIAVWCEKHRADFDVASGGLAGSGSDRKESVTSSPSVMLGDYCRVLVDQEPDLGIDQVRLMATAQAAVFGVSSDASGEVVEAVLESLFPAELADEGDGSGSVGGDLD